MRVSYLVEGVCAHKYISLICIIIYLYFIFVVYLTTLSVAYTVASIFVYNFFWLFHMCRWKRAREGRGRSLFPALFVTCLQILKLQP
jgi:hypothetical protein